MSPLDTYFILASKAKYGDGNYIPFFFKLDDGSFAASYKMADELTLSSDEETRVKDMIASIRDSKELIRKISDSHI